MHSTNMHGFIEGSVVVERTDHYKTQQVVVGIMGYYKDDLIQLNNEQSAWEFARDYYSIVGDEL